MNILRTEPNFSAKLKKILNLCLRWPILRSYRFVAEVTFKAIRDQDNWDGSAFNEPLSLKQICQFQTWIFLGMFWFFTFCIERAIKFHHPLSNFFFEGFTIDFMTKCQLKCIFMTKWHYFRDKSIFRFFPNLQLPKVWKNKTNSENNVILLWMNIYLI